MHTVVSFHAHPDDEVLICGGTLARAAAGGHRVVVVFATDGEAGLADAYHGAGRPAELGERRRAEARAACDTLGVSRVEFLGYPDSGSGATPAAGTFAATDVSEAAGRLATLLREEAADVLTTYDVRGGYGHPDHRQVHRVGARAAELAGTAVVLQATVDRSWLWRLTRLAARIPGVPGYVGASRLKDGFADPAEITHRVDVRRYAVQKRAALEAHRSQHGGGREVRTAALLLRLPRPVFRAALGREWFVQTGRAPGAAPSDDIFDALSPGLRAVGAR